MSVVVAAVVGGFVAIMGLWIASGASKNDGVYGLAHANLNWERPGGLWLNMGWWDSDSQPFAEACKSLVRLVARKASLDKMQAARVLDVGNGCGDQDVLLFNEFPVSSILGVNNEGIQVHAANERVFKAVPSAKAQFVVGDAVHPSSWESIDGRGVGQKLEKFDAVIAVDCAYHFQSRQAFFEAVSRKLLKPRGTFALADIIGGTGEMSRLERCIFKLVLSAANVPVENLWASTEEVRKRLSDCGFEAIEISDVTNTVFGGFVKFLARYDQEGPGSIGSKFAYRTFRWMLEYAVERQWLHFIIASGALADNMQ